MNDQSLIDRIYEAALMPELWSDVLSAISERRSFNGATLWVKGTASGHSEMVSTGRHVELTREMSKFASYPVTRLHKLSSLRIAGFASDHDLFTDAEMDSNPYYTEFLRPRDVGWAAATLIHPSSNERVSFGFSRSNRLGPVPAPTISYLNGLRPHLARATLLASRMGFQRSMAKADGLEAMGRPAAIIGPQGAIIAQNNRFMAHIPEWFQDRTNRLTLNHEEADKIFARAVSELRQSGSHMRVRSILLFNRDRQHKCVLHIIPIVRHAKDIFNQAAALIIVTRLIEPAAPDLEIVEALFDLTPAEARVAAAIADGKTPREIARQNGTSVTTVRNQLNRVLSKSGLNRQSELVAVLRNVSRYNRASAPTEIRQYDHRAPRDLQG